jgi:hypothetical protein
MAREKHYSRGEQVFTDPRKAAAKIRGLMAQGAQVYGTRNAMSQVGIQPHHFVADRDETSKKMPDAEAQTLAKQMAKVQPDPDQVKAPTKTSNPSDPRTAAASYYSQTQTLVVQWGDGGTAYAYYDVTPQEWDAFTKVDSPGRFINAVLNNHNYGPIKGN